MNKVGTIYLISNTFTQDAYGIRRKTETQRKLRCQVNSIYGYESANAKVNNIKAEYRFDVRATEYHGEDKLIYKNIRYSVYRFFERDDARIELYVQKDVGA